MKFVKDNNSTMNHYEIAKELGRTPNAVRHKINKLNINKERTLYGDEKKNGVMRKMNY